MASIVSGPFLAACAVLALAGIRKLWHPATTQTALAALHLPRSVAAVRAIGFAEVTVAAIGIAFGGWFALGVAVAYVALTVAAWRLLRRAPGTPCGCLGAPDAPVSASHVAVNLAAALVSVAAATGAAPWSYLPDHPARAVAFLVVTACLAHVATLMIDAQPALSVAMQRGRSR